MGALPFSLWLKQRRKALDLTQEELAEQVGCAVTTIRKLEAGSLRPSKQIAERLADQLELTPEERTLFVQSARAVPTDQPSAILEQAPSILPTGTVTFLFTDIVGSTQLWELHRRAMLAALTRHDTILRHAIAAHGGVVFKTAGDSFCAAFATAPSALLAAHAAQCALSTEDWGAPGPLQVRMALHTGTATEREGDYLGSSLNRTARLLAAGHGGQILLAQSTEALVHDDLPPGVELRDLGSHRLRDLSRPEHIFQLVSPDLPANFPTLRTLEARPTNLPTQSTPLIGREREVAAVSAMLRRTDVRLLTLTGPGGTGKTRLSLQVAVELLDVYTNGVYFVALAPIGDPSLVAFTIAQTLGVVKERGQALLESLKDYFRDRHLLLLLDNFEQVVAAAPLVTELLAAAPQLNVLITSRAPLHLYGENEFAVPPLMLPDHKQLPPLERLTQYEAVRLFVERSRAVKADFAVTNANAPAVAEICYRLDGLPLAIELAAARSKILWPQAMLARMNSRLTLLTGGAHDLPTRQQTLRNTIAWSYELLDTWEQTLFMRLAVFIGGFTLEAAEVICKGDLPTSMIDGLTALVDKSLLRQEEGLNGDPCFKMLETIREFALERLEESGTAVAIRRRHLHWCLALAEAAEPHLIGGSRQETWLHQLENEHDNLRAALSWSLDAKEAEAGLRLAAALSRFWYFRGYWREGRDWIMAALAQTAGLEHTPTRAKALSGAGVLAYFQGDFAGARALVEEGLTLFQEVGDKRSIAGALNDLGELVRLQGDYLQAVALFEEGLALYRALDDTSGIALALNNLGTVALSQGDYTRAVALLEHGLALYQAIEENGGIAWALNNLGTAALYQNDFTRAKVLFEEGLTLYQAVEDKDGIAWALSNLGAVSTAQGNFSAARTHYAHSLAISKTLETKALSPYLEELAKLAIAQGQAEQGALLLGAAEVLRNAIGAPMSPADRSGYDRTVAAIRARLDPVTFTAAWAKGRMMTFEQAITYAFAMLQVEHDPVELPAHATITPPANYPAGLTAREAEVLNLVAKGLTNAQMADQLIVSPRTINAHLTSIYSKLGITSRSAAMRFAIDHQLV